MSLEVTLFLLGLVAIVGILFHRFVIPIPLILVCTGIILSLFGMMPHIELNPTLVLNVFLPMLLYQISGFSSWKDVEKNIRPITLLSIGHVLFITLLVAALIRVLIPSISWPLAFVIGSVVSPPDDVAISAIAEKIQIPKKVLTILEGEGMLNDAAALLIFRFSLAALVGHQFSVFNAVTSFIVVVVLETLYGIFVAYMLGTIRLKFQDPILHMLLSILTPFVAYLPPSRMGGCGVIAVVVCGFVMGYHFAVRYPPQVRLTYRAIWPTLSYGLQNFLFLLVGFNMRYIIDKIEGIPYHHLALYTLLIILAVILGRFLWVFGIDFLEKSLFSLFRKKRAKMSWQELFLISWSGMRGGISLAAALAVPILPASGDLDNPRDLVIFLVFCVIIATLVIQGVTLPYLMQLLGVPQRTREEEQQEQYSENTARIKMANAVIKWLKEYQETVRDNEKLEEAVSLQISHYRLLKKQLKERSHLSASIDVLPNPINEELLLYYQIIDVEKNELFRLWQKEEISHAIRTRLLDNLDHRAVHLGG